MLATARSSRVGTPSACMPQIVRSCSPVAPRPISCPVQLSKCHFKSRGGCPARYVAANVASGQSQGTRGENDTTGKRNIIFPVDNSNDSEFAVSWALDHLYKASDCLHLLHCIPPYHNKETFNEAEALAHSERQAATKEEVRKRFEAKLILSSVPKSDIVYDILEEEHAPVVLFGVPDADLEDQQAADAIQTPNLTGDAIIKKALEFNAEAVVMATHNKGPIAEFFVGSVTNYCSHHCPKPVVVLHNIPRTKGSTVQMGSGRALAVAVDNTAVSEKALQWMLENVYRNGDVVHVMHAVPPLGGDVAVADGFGDPVEAADDGVSEKYKSMLEAANIPYEIDVIQEHFIDSIKADSVRLGTALVSKAEDIDASMLVMTSHSKGGVDEFLLGSVTNFVTHNANELPVIVLHP